MQNPLSAFRLSNLLQVVNDVIGWSEKPDVKHTANNDAWLNSMLGSVSQTAYACIHNEDMDFKKLDRIRVECNSLLHAIHANAWPQQSEPTQVRRLKCLLPDLESALVEADKELEQSALVSFGVEETKAEGVKPEGDWREHDVKFLLGLFQLKNNGRNSLLRLADTAEHPYLKKSSRGRYLLDHSNPFIIGKKAELSTI